ncbi:MAG: hypothetical protein ACKO2P_17210 [Planctomycetota bacterium]
MNSPRLFPGLLFAACCVAGCITEDPAAVAARTRFLVTTPPAKEQPIPEVHKGLNDSTLQPGTLVTVRARINAGDFPPFADGLAAFVVTDATNQDGDETHNPHECPFCKRDIEVQMARVQFTDDSGQTLKFDARQLFNLKEFDLLVVQGTAKFDEDKSLIITAQKLFVKR